MAKYRVYCERNEVVVEADYYKVEEGCLHMRNQRPAPYHLLAGGHQTYPVTKITFAPHAWDRIELVPDDA